MLIYAVADIHGKPERLSLIRKKINDTAPDVLVVAGDITGYIRPVPTIEALNNMPVLSKKSMRNTQKCCYITV